jgi:hypothetical protein
MFAPIWTAGSHVSPPFVERVERIQTLCAAS